MTGSILLRTERDCSRVRSGRQEERLSEVAGAGAAPERHIDGMGIITFREKNYLTAESDLQRAILYAPDCSTVHRYYALALTCTGRQEKSRRELELAASLEQKEIFDSHSNPLTVVQ